MGHVNRIKVKNLTQNLILAIAATIIILVIAELFIRLADPQIVNYTQFDSMLMYKHVPNFEFRYFRQEFDNNIKFNSKGLREREYAYEKENNVYRILILGDSFTEALQVDLDSSFPKVLEEKLNSRLSNKYEVINAGIGGYGTENELLFYEFEGKKYEPNLVILAVFLNDVNDNTASPLITFDNSKLMRHIPLKASLPKKFVLYCSRYSHICALSQKIILENLGDANIKHADEIYLKNSSAEFEKSLNEINLLLEQFRQMVDDDNDKFVVLLIPAREQVSKEFYEKYLIDNNLEEKDLFMNKFQEKIKSFGRAKNINVIDLLPRMKEISANNSLYFEIDGHWNEKGHEFAAELLYDYLNYRK